MKKLAMVAALLTLAGCVQVDKYNEVVKAPAPAGLEGYWQTKGPQRSLVSPEAIGSLIITKDGDTLDCRQWQRTIAVPGKLMMRGDDLYNVTQKRDVYSLSREDGALEYDGMTLERVERPTVECTAALEKAPPVSALPTDLLPTKTETPAASPVSAVPAASQSTTPDSAAPAETPQATGSDEYSGTQPQS